MLQTTSARLALLATFAVLALAACIVSAGEDVACPGEHAAGCESAIQPVTNAGGQPAAPVARAVPAFGMKVNIDPKTGEYTDQAPAVPTQGSSVAGVPHRPTERLLPGGARALDTRHVRQEMTATANPDGSVSTRCKQVINPGNE